MMNADFAIALPHTILLTIYTFLLILTLVKKNNTGYYWLLGLIGLDCLWNIQMGTGDVLLHCAKDLLAMGAISSLYFIIKQPVLRTIVMLFSVAAFFGMHLSVTPEERPQKNIQHTSDLVELFIEFESKTHLKEWLEKEGYSYQHTYPLFKPEDTSFLLDEYVLVSLPTDEIDAFLLMHNNKTGITHIEVNDVVMLKMPELKAAKTYKSSQSLNDPMIKKQWTADPYDLAKFHKLTSKHKIKNLANNSVIAILDTGVQGEHEDLKENYISTSKRYDSDIKGHGTHCAGIAAAVTGNKIGIASFIPQGAPVKITSIKVLNNMGMGSQKTIIDGIIKAADSGCSVISLSLGGISSDAKEKAYSEAVRYANAKGSIVIVAAGNSGRDAIGYTPANAKGVIAVTAVDTLMRKANFGNTVSSLEMGIAAPGTEIYSTFPGNAYKAFNGTSMAAPFVSGLVGLMKAYDPNLTTEQVYKIINESSSRSNSLSIIDPVAALTSFFNTHLES